MAKSKRKVINYLKTSGLNSSYTFHILAGGVAFLGMIMIYVSKLLSEVQGLVSESSDMGLVDGVHDRLLAVAVLFFLCFFAFLLATVFYMIVLGQRVGGPVVAICAYIQALKKGQYDGPRSLRKNDELTAIMQELNELAETLREKKFI